MSLREMPTTFTCDGCAQTEHLDLLCRAASTAAILRCVRCCPCHRQDDPGGVAVFVAQAGRLQWRGLHGRAWRRSHP